MNSRRNFLRSSLIMTSSLSLDKLYIDKEDESIANDSSRCLDYGKSFICNSGQSKASNAVRMWIESRIVLRDKTGSEAIYYQGASCKSENTFASKDLFKGDNYDFLPVFGADRMLVFRRYFNERQNYRTIHNMTDMFGTDPVIKLPIPKKITLLDTFDKIREATFSGIPIVTQTDIYNTTTGLSCLIECPCKTMNINSNTHQYQTDTGPILLPDLNRKFDEPFDALRLAYIAFNSSNFADFVVESLVPIFHNNKKVSSVFHYSELVSYRTENRVYAVE